MVEDSILSIDQRLCLLRLYLEWPERVDTGDDNEANEFYFWLAEELDERDFDDITGGLDGIKEFIKSNHEVLARARFLKNRRNAVDAREDDRISINTQLFLLVYDCTTEPSLEGSILHGLVLDIGRSGLRVETDTIIPPGTIISMTVAQLGSHVTRYNLTGEVRWSAEQSPWNHLGVMIFNIEEYEQWQDFYFAMSSCC